jgi:hypothetical protein
LNCSRQTEGGGYCYMTLYRGGIGPSQFHHG